MEVKSKGLDMGKDLVGKVLAKDRIRVCSG